MCVSLVGDTYIGQGVISQRSYMRGIIYSNDTWEGEYWKAGGTTQGTFRLRLIDGGSTLATYSGEITGPNERSNRIYGFQIGFSMPDPTLCLQTEASELSPSAIFTFLGVWQGWFMSNDINGTINATYLVPVNSSTPVSFTGVAVGNPFGQQVWGFKWSDTRTDAAGGVHGNSSASGIGLAVTRTADSFHCLMLPQANGELLYQDIRWGEYSRQHESSTAAAGREGSETLETGITVLLSIILALFLVSLCCCYAGLCAVPLSYLAKKSTLPLRSQRPVTFTPVSVTHNGPTMVRTSAPAGNNV